MRKGLLVRLIPLAAIGLVAGLAAVLSAGPASSRAPVANNVLRHALEVELGRASASRDDRALSSGVLYTLLDQTGALSRRAARSGVRPRAVEIAGTEGCQNQFTGNSQTNTRVTQDCSLRSQAGESIALNPTDPNNMLVSQNDSRIGFNHCSFSWTLDSGAHWGEQTPPFFQLELLDQHTADACADPTVAWDSRGTAYIASTIFNVQHPENAVVVAKSNPGIHGTYFHSTDAQGGFQEYRSLPLGVVANDDDPNIFNDKPFVAADSNPSSPKRNAVYVTWTKFKPESEDAPGGVRQVNPIMFSQSFDGGATWSTPIEISGEAEGVCPQECNHDQGSHPVVGRDGTIYVTFANNDPIKPGEQILMVKCPADQDCTIPESWSAPVIVSDLIGGMPIGPSAAGCPIGQQCLPPNGYQLSEQMSISNSVDSGGNFYVTWADFRNNTNAQCTGAASTARAPCDNDVFYSVSTDGGDTWTKARDVTPRSNARFGETAQWQPWSKVTQDGSTLWISFYDRSYGDCETTGCNDITMAEILAPASDNPTYRYSRVTTSSMPNLTTTANPIEAGFLGDRMSLDVDAQGRAHVVWADTRQHAGSSPEEDVYYARVPAAGPPPPPPPPPPGPPPPGAPPPPGPPPPPPPPPPPAPPSLHCVVPRVVGRSLGRARSALRRAHCRLGSVRRARSAARTGRVIGQDRRPGTRLPRGARIGLVVSAGRPFLAPPFTG